MKKTKTFEQYLKEADNRLSPLEDEDDDENPLGGVGSAVDNLANIMDKMPVGDEGDEAELPEEDAVEDLTDELEDETGEDLPGEEFELDTVPTEQPVLEPEEAGIPLEDESGLDVMGEAPMPMETEVAVESAAKKTVYLYAGVNNINQPDPSFDAVENAKNSMQGCECEVIKLFQLNIQPVAVEEPEDGMQLIYDQIADADVIVLASPISGGAVSSLANNAIDRIGNHYGPNGLKNKIFGSILVGEDDSFHQVKASLASKAINLGMIVAPEGNIHVGGAEGADFAGFAASIASLRDATDGIRTDVVEPGIDDGASDVLSFGEFAGAADAVADELGPEAEPAPMDQIPDGGFAEPDAEMPAEEPMDEMPAEEPMDDESPEEVDEAPDDVEDIPEEDMLEDEPADSDADDETEEPETDEEEEIEIMGEAADWHFPDVPSMHKKLNKLNSFSEVTTKKKDGEEFKDGTGTSAMPKSKVDIKKGASKESTIKNKKAPKLDAKEVQDGSGTSKLPGGKKDGKKGSHVDSGARVDVRYFKGMGSTGKEAAHKGGDGIENFADFTKRI